jgi:peroxiredoxin
MRKKVIILIGLHFLIFFVSSPLSWTKECFPVKLGDPFPPFTLKNNLSKEETKALHLPSKESISLQDFDSETILIELLNVYCHTCQLQVPIFNQLWDAVQSNKTLKSKVTVLGITVGNSTKEINKFQKSFEANYPILADPSKDVFDCLGNPKGTPQTYLLRKDSSGKWYILYHHRGAVNSYEIYLKKIKEFFKSDLEGIEPGYKVPKHLLKTLKARYPTETFEKRRMLIYFPSTTVFPLDDDMRNTASQMNVLLSLINEEKLAIVIIGFLGQIFPLKELEMLKKTPNTLLLEDGMGMLASQFGAAETPLIFLVNDMGRIVYRTDSLTRARAEELLKGKVPQLKPNITEGELLESMQKSMKAVNSEIERTEKKESETGGTIYLGFTSAEREEASLFGKVVSKYSICDVCHDIHYYYIIDQNGYLVSFNPIFITKYGNVSWEKKDIEKLKSRILGKDTFKNLSFDPYVDAVSQATMSSYLIFDGLNEAKIVFKDFKDYGFRKEYWREICLNNLCQIKKGLTIIKKKGIADSITLEDQTSIDMKKLKTYLPYHKLSKCLIGGKYLLIGEIPICSIHGMNLKPCPEEPTAEKKSR